MIEVVIAPRRHTSAMIDLAEVLLHRCRRLTHDLVELGLACAVEESVEDVWRVFGLNE